MNTIPKNSSVGLNRATQGLFDVLSPVGGAKLRRNFFSLVVLYLVLIIWMFFAPEYVGNVYLIIGYAFIISAISFLHMISYSKNFEANIFRISDKNEIRFLRMWVIVEALLTSFGLSILFVTSRMSLFFIIVIFLVSIVIIYQIQNHMIDILLNNILQTFIQNFPKDIQNSRSAQIYQKYWGVVLDDSHPMFQESVVKTFRSVFNMRIILVPIFTLILLEFVSPYLILLLI